MKFKFFALLVFLTIPFTVSAQEKNKYVGYEYTGVVVNETLPNGVKDLGGNLIGDFDYAVSHMRKGSKDMIWLTRIKNRNDEGVPNWKVAKVLVLPKLKKDQQIVSGFKSPCKLGKKEDITLIVLTNFSVKSKTYTPEKAWRANILKDNFEEVSIAKVNCKNGK